jgi:hypothetical protein
LPGLHRALQHDSFHTVTDAAKAILRIAPDDREAKDALLKLLRQGVQRKPDDIFDIPLLAKCFAAEVIAEFGASFPEARPILVELIRRGNGMSWPHAALAIRAIDQAAAKRESPKP